MHKRIIDETTPLRIGSDVAELFPKILAVANPVFVETRRAGLHSAPVRPRQR